MRLRTQQGGAATPKAGTLAEMRTLTRMGMINQGPEPEGADL